MKINTGTLAVSIAVVIGAYFLSQAIAHRYTSNDVISVTGLGQQDFESDLIVWGGRFSQTHPELKSAYNLLEKDRKVILQYLTSKGLKAEEIIFSSVDIFNRTQAKYDNGKYTGEEFVGHELTQRVQVESKNVSLTETISREITELINQGIPFMSDQPEYYYTKLADLKVSLISKATEDAQVRSQMIAENAQSKLGKLKAARMGVFQITGQNSNEEFSWGGVFNTSSKNKTAVITVKLDYFIK
ncbi:MAG TPA: SIMPL domain-containing protein [Bacteroidia bacterium]|nr:SIMPL domain-containing protein [Bacteroidia bacterium]HNT79614.1 SIMPL domain-containing protein [Bacteroidia bacterium]